MSAGRRAERGQAIVLLAVTAVIVAFTVLTTLSIGSAIENRIRLQQTADAAAYSMAVQEARTFNFFAFSNRAIVAHYVAAMSVYGYMSYLALYEGYLNQLCLNWGCFSSQCFTNQMKAAGVSSSAISQAQSNVNDTSGQAQAAGQQLSSDKSTLVAAQQQLAADQRQQGQDCGADPSGSACSADNAAVSTDQNNVDNAQSAVNSDQNTLQNLKGNVGSNPAAGSSGNPAVYASLIDNVPTELLLECIGWCVAAAASFGALAQQCEACTQCDAQEIPYIEDTLCQNVDGAITDVDQKLGKTGGSAIADLKDFASFHVKASQVMVDTQNGLSASLVASLMSLPGDVAKAADPGISVPNSLVLGGINGKRYCDANSGCPPPAPPTGTNLDAQWKAANATRYGRFAAATVGGADFLIDREETKGLSPLDGALDLAFSGGAGGVASNFADLRFNKVAGTGMSELIGQASGSVHDAVHANSAGGYSVAGEDHGRVISTDLACIEQGSVTMAVATPAFDVQVWAYSEPTDTAQGGNSCSGQPGTSQLRWEDGTVSTNQGGQNPIDLTLGTCSKGQAGVAMPTANFLIQDPSKDPLQGQPRTWAVLSKTFSGNSSDAAYEGPFAMKTNLTLFGSDADVYDNTIAHDVPWNSMVAFSQGLVYYHRPGDWQEPPNFYNPFWRAKIHPVMSRGDLTELIGLATTSVGSGSGITAGAGTAALLGLPLTE